MNGWSLKLLVLTFLAPAFLPDSEAFNPALLRGAAGAPSAQRALPPQALLGPSANPYQGMPDNGGAIPAAPAAHQSQRLDFLRDRILIAPDSAYLLGGGGYEELAYAANGALSRLRDYRNRFESPAILFNDLDSVIETRGAVPLVARMEGVWREGAGGLRYRVNYLNVPGLSRMSEEGLRAYLSDREIGDENNQAPVQYWKVYPVFQPNQAAQAELEIHNAGEAAFENLRLLMRLETFSPQGAQGLSLGPLILPGTAVGRLAPRQRMKIPLRFEVQSDGRYRVNLSQLHLLAWTDGSQKPLVNDTQAGIVDPPTD